MNKGVRDFQKSADVLSADAILSHLPADFSGEVVVKDVTASTNADVRAVAATAKHGTTVIANAQTNGRGRLGRSFFAPEGGVYMSMLLRLGSKFSDAVLVTSAAAVAVCRAIESVSEVKPEIKWVNDIFVGGKKICGILCEAIPGDGGIDSVILGIGVNYCGVEFPEELVETAGCLFDGEAAVSRNVFVAEVMKQVLSIVEDMGSREYLEEYRARSMVVGREVRYLENGVWHEAKAVGVDENGGLEIVEGGEKRVLVSGEVSLRVQ